MKKNFLLFLILVLTLIPIAGCSNSNPANTNAQGRYFLWQVSSDVSTIYILGSIHLARSDIYPLSNTIESAFDQSQNLVVEVDVSKIDQAYLQKLIAEKGMYPAGDSLQNHISPELYTQTNEILQESGVDISTMDSFKPWLVAVTIEDLQLMKLGYDTENGIDTHFINKAVEDNRNIIELETAEYQLDLFDRLPEELQVMLLEDDIDNPITADDLEKMFEAWENGDVTTLEEIAFKPLSNNHDLKPLYEKLYDERNTEMAGRIENFLADDKTFFVVVGAGHLVGEKGIINLLKEKGYSTEQL